jgi:acetyl-CoA acetyltransferase
MGSLTKKAAIVGVAESDLLYVPDKTDTELQAQATKRALDDAGLEKGDIDAVFCIGQNMESCLISEYMGIVPTYADTTQVGGSSFEFHVEHAAAAIAAGLCHTALITHASTMVSSRRAGQSGRWFTSPQEPEAQYEEPYGSYILPGYAMAAMRHMHQYGTTSEQLAEIAVSTRKWAALNPKASMRDPLTIQDVLNSPMISAPLRQRDCCLTSDGGGAVIITSPERAQSLKKPPVWILGCGETHTHRGISSMPDFAVTPAKISGAAAFKMAGLTPADIDVVEVYDSFTITVLLELEDLGFCPKGEGGRFVAGQRLAPGGALPTNTSGGGLSYLHTGMFGIFLLIEAARQLRGECGKRQVPGAKTALCNGMGGILSSSSTIILGKD